MNAVLFCALALLTTASARRLQPSGEKDLQVQSSSSFSKDDDDGFEESMMELLATSTRAAMGIGQNSDGPEDPEPTDSHKEIDYDVAWFKDNCKTPKAVNTAYYNGDSNAWRPGKKCEVPWEGAPDIVEVGGSTLATNDKEGCATKCQEVADGDTGSTYCCEWDGNEGTIDGVKVKGKCTVVKSFLSIEPSKKGGLFKKLIHGEKQKHAKFVKSSKAPAAEKGSEVVDGETEDVEANQEKVIDDEMEDVEASQETMRELVKQVNHMSIEGILRHLLSFYICMRWVPDEQYINLARHEFENVDLDMQTQKTAKPMTKDELFATYVNFDAVPMKCSSGMSVQNTDNIDDLLTLLTDADSPIKEAYQFSKDVASETWNSFKSFSKQKWFGSIADTEKRMGNEVEIEEMAAKVRTALPWDGFIRPSQRFTWGMGQTVQLGTIAPHVSSPDNLFFVCFGPRVSSFPHKRDQGGHFLADMNMAGCNGLWNLEDVTKHVARVRRLFAPETCLTENMKQKLRAVFLETFVDMNKNFEKKLIGKFFSQRQDDMETIPEELLPKSLIPIEEADLEGRSLADHERLVKNKYERVGRLVSGAHTKWIVCDAKHPASPATGLASSFFNSPQAYAKWFKAGTLGDPTKPECKTYDPLTGCMRCVFAVRTHPYRCLNRLGLDAKQILSAIESQMSPLPSNYNALKTLDLEDGRTKETLVKKRGVCVVAKDVSNVNRSTNLEKFREMGPLDRVFQVEKSDVDKMGFLLRNRYAMQDRQTHLGNYIQHNGVLPEKDEASMTKEERDSEDNKRIVHLKMVGNSQTHYPLDNFGPLVTFSDVIEEENNVAGHEVDYFITCPCESDDFSSIKEYEKQSTKRMGDYMLS